jgi:hypothetical protein
MQYWIIDHNQKLHVPGLTAQQIPCAYKTHFILIECYNCVL